MRIHLDHTDSEPHSITKDRYVLQYAAALSTTTCMFGAGIAVGWNSPSIPILISPDSPIPMNIDQGSWLITVAIFGLLATSYPTVWCARRFGPKWTLLSCAIPLLVGWLLIALARNVATLFVARVFFGFAYGINYTLMPVYLSEIASDRVRGSLLALSPLMVKSGALFCLSLAPFVSLRTMALAAMVPCAVFVCTFAWMPESPYYLVTRGIRDETDETDKTSDTNVYFCAAQRTLVRLRGHANVEAELHGIEQTIRQQLAEKRQHRGSQNAWRQLMAPEQRRALIIGIGTSMIVPLCGSSAISDYSQIIFAKIDWQLSAVSASIVLAAVQLMSSVLSNVTIDWWGRRPLLLASCATMAVCTAVVAVYFAFEERWRWDTDAAGWLPVAALMVFQFAFSVGLEPVNVTLVGELFGAHVKSLASAVFLVLYSTADVVVGKLFQTVSDSWGSDVAFGALSAFTVAYVVFAVMRVPETKGRKLEDILEEIREK